MVKKHNLRFVMGDLNMSAYQLCHDLRARGIECNLLCWHCEMNSDATDVVFDSCVIIAIGGPKYDLKPNTTGTHILMGAQLPWPPKSKAALDKNPPRGFPRKHYIDDSAPPIFTAGYGIPDDIMDKAKRLQGGEKMNVEEMRKQTVPSSEPKETSDPAFPVTSGFHPFGTLRGRMANPNLWDAEETLWNSQSHWPLMLQVGSYRARSDQAWCKPSKQNRISPHIV